jgi:hypothetical protein
MSALGQKLPRPVGLLASAFTPKADIAVDERRVRCRPIDRRRIAIARLIFAGLAPPAPSTERLLLLSSEWQHREAMMAVEKEIVIEF